MSTCPTKEMLSLYLDNELPQNYKEQLEAHVAGCDKCRAELEKLRAISSVFHKNAELISPDKKFTDESYERLMLKMKYSKNAGHTFKPVSRVWKIVVPAVAAVAVLALAVPLMLAAGKANVKTMSATSSLYSQMPSQVSEQLTEQLSNVSFGGENSFVRNTSGAASKLIQDVEVFRPAFDEDKKTISIRITIPGNDDVPVTTEIEVPLDVTGQN